MKIATRILCAVAASAATLPSHAAAQSCSAPYRVQETFTGRGHQTQWDLCWSAPSSWGLVISAAWFRPAAEPRPWRRVFWDARLAEIYVPYDPGSPRFYDLSGVITTPVTLTERLCPPSVGVILGGVVCREVRDRGLVWKADTSSYRGRELVLWSVLRAGNYEYIQTWRFRDDGAVVGEMAPTGVNLPWPDRWNVAHTHDAVWRLDVDVGSAHHDRVDVISHVQRDTAVSTDSMRLVTVEQGVTWDPVRYTALSVYDTNVRNGRGNITAYWLVPSRGGAARHYRFDERWTLYDFWVTKFRDMSQRPRNIPSDLRPPQRVVDTDVVVWYNGSLHHMFRDEDGEYRNNRFTGVAQGMSTGFMLMPHNLFNGPPFMRP
jgi:primary-amine oxidase